MFPLLVVHIHSGEVRRHSAWSHASADSEPHWHAHVGPYQGADRDSDSGTTFDECMICYE